jgi:hypothetical protein
MLTAAKTPKKKIIIYALIIISMIAGNAFIYYNNNRADRLGLDDEDFISALNLDQGLTDASDRESAFSQSVLEHNVFITLKKIGDWPIIPSDVGKADPFAPLSADID